MKNTQEKWVAVRPSHLNNGWDSRWQRCGCPVALAFKAAGFDGVSVDIKEIVVGYNTDKAITYKLTGKALKFYVERILGIDVATANSVPLSAYRKEVPKPKPFEFLIPRRGQSISRIRYTKEVA